MPTLMNGCGTIYYGKKNIRQREDTCDNCGHEVVLSSYDTGYFFVIFLIPLIPLGKKRILDYCPQCTNHRFMKLSEWEQTKADALEKAKQEFRENPSDIEVAKKSLGVFATYMDPEGLKVFTIEFLKSLGGNEEVLNTLGAMQAYLSLWEEAKMVYRKAIEINPNNYEAKEGLAHILMRQGSPDEAEKLLGHIIERGEPDKMGYLYELVESYQAQGSHKKALLYLEHCLRLVPQIESEKYYKKAKSSDFGGKLAWIIPPIILIACLFFYLSFHEGQNRKIYLVNGLSQSYSVKVNGSKPTVIMNGKQRAFTVKEGEIKIETVSEHYPIETKTVIIKTNFSLGFS